MCHLDSKDGARLDEMWDRLDGLAIVYLETHIRRRERRMVKGEGEGGEREEGDGGNKESRGRSTSDGNSSRTVRCAGARVTERSEPYLAEKP